MLRHLKNDIILAVTLFLLLLLTGTLGYHFSQGFDWVDAFYMTVITVTTVGFGEVMPLDTFGKIFTVFLILFSIIVYAYTIGVVTEYIIGENFFKKLIVKRMEKKIARLEGHVVLTGYGRTGRQALKKLLADNRKVVVIDVKKPEDDSLSVHKNVFFIEGDATLDEVMKKSALDKADALISAINDDAKNLLIVLSARQINPSLNIVARASDEQVAEKMKIAGADHVTLPEVIGGEYMASLILTPDLVEFIDALSAEEGGQKNNLVEIHIDDLPKEYRGKTIRDLNLRQKTGCSVIGYKTPDKKYIINPPADTPLVNGSAIIVLGQPEQIRNLYRLFKI